MGIKERRTKIILALYLLSDGNFSPVALDDRIQKIFDLSMNQKTRGTLAGLLKEGLIEKKGIETGYEDGNENLDKKIPSSTIPLPNPLPNPSSNLQYSLTEKGFYSLCLEFPLFRYLKDKWDGKWRIISYEIPEKKREIRDRLRREMQGWGLGPWHRSFWLTPHPIIETLRQLVSQKEEEKYIQAFEADHGFGDREVLIEKVWQKTEIDKKYREMFKVWHDILSTDSDKTDKFRKVIAEYVSLLRLDPGLPVELVGEKWIGFEASNIFREIKSILLA